MTLINDNCLHYLRTVDDNTYDLIVTDPPYGIAFMGKDWDKALPDKQVWKECFRVLKEGKMAFIMCSPRQDVLSRMIISLGDAGFRTNYTSIYWTFASGFPKAKNNRDGSYVGFQPKPAVEVILVVSKGKSLTWLDDCRIPYSSDSDVKSAEIGRNDNPRFSEQVYGLRNTVTDYYPNQKGRFPANLLVSDDVLNDGSIHKSGSINDVGYGFRKDGILGHPRTDGLIKRETKGDSGSYSRYFDLDKWYSQFIITPKASKSERNKGCEDLPQRYLNTMGDGIGEREHNPNEKTAWVKNNHPTVKPLKLMSYLITMGSREGDTILDPFVGSGTTYIAAIQLNRKAIGIELNPEYYEIAQARIVPYLQQTKLDMCKY